MDAPSTLLGAGQRPSTTQRQSVPTRSQRQRVCQRACARQQAAASLQQHGKADTGRRQQFLAATTGFLLQLLPTGLAWADDEPVTRVDIDTTQAPDQSRYNSTDESLRDAAQMLQTALDATSVKEEERLFTQLIDKYRPSVGKTDTPWAADVVGRAIGNRGNARSRQGDFNAAIRDYNEAMVLCPWSVDPMLNRGVVLEAQGRWDEAVADYQTVLRAAPEDPSAWNNLGNANAGLGRWDEAAKYYGRAAELAPAFSFAACNQALATYQMGEQEPSRTEEAVRQMRNLLRKYPDFPDVRAALAAALWAQGDGGEAEANWFRVEDPRYRDRAWLSATRRWPPRLVASLVSFLDIQSSKDPKQG